ncbi:hypothetical protein NJB14197_17180 [Mycobacterium montefiorense]|uniref:DUF4226 domain-containing protein n=1 Tax=Mycobacterium montefiorense TaxID=154654 RepID=A0AA37UWI6_9MYCO|nr:hypothetical protein MmonteBS_53200 [Mycobacterium montefiorense]GKU35140.1 hypothetical protein NJB14191_24860 [Mycobacterium montefiorense]GKU40059.1 hypothetical protein NJB14192_20470 [Mycobacterium montefiorense]GKU47210.1 hypothetical protein NJB14194_38280 [Mycobacterium montefiorense]GKU49453.1 hypothetical protein NJB14195_07000 [Mycobacterium montefiorense]
MSTYDALLATVKAVRDRTGDPNAWQTGLTPTELAAVVTPTPAPPQLDAILAKIRRQHLDPPLGDREQGAAAEAIAGAEAALAYQNSASSQLDLQVISAIMNAHLRTVEGAEALGALQRDTEAAVQTRSDLDTPAGARDFQRFLIGKLRDIRAVVMNASLDDTSKSALMAAWTSLYDASKTGPSAAGESKPAPVSAVAAPVRDSGQQPPDAAAAGWDPLLDPLLTDDPGLPGEDPGESAAAPTMPSMLPTIPNVALGPTPGPGSMAGWGTPSGLALPGREGGGESDPALGDLDDEALDASQRFDVGGCGGAEHGGHHARQTDLRSHQLKHHHVTVARGDDMALALAAHRKTHHYAAEIASPPPALQAAVRPAERVDHRCHRRVRLALVVQHSLGGEVALHLIPDEVPQLLLGNVRANPKRRRKIEQLHSIGDHQHAVDGHLHPDDIVEGHKAASEVTGRHQ